MTTVIFDISISLDGYVTDVDQTDKSPLGREGDRLHAWLGGDPDDLAALVPASAIITGHRNLRHSLPYWGADGPSRRRRIPVVVLSGTGGAGTELPESSVYEFATSPESALDRARDIAGNGDVCVMGGARTAQSFLRGGFIDEISLHVMPVLFGGGMRLFDSLPARLTELERVACIPTASATHVRYRLVR